MRSVQPNKRIQCACLARYKSRWVLSWPIILILVQNCLVFLFAASFRQQRARFDLVSTFLDSIVYNNIDGYGSVFIVSVVTLWSLAGFVSAWLIGWKYKLTDIVMMGVVIVSIGVLLKTILALAYLTASSSVSKHLIEDINYFVALIMVVGAGTVVNNALQLAIEQNPEASADQLSSLISWFVLSSSIGWWLQAIIRDIYMACIGPSVDTIVEYDPVVKLLVCCVCALSLILGFLFKHKFLDNSLTSNAIRKVYAVLKYAYKHKFPERRSAMTYWEDAPVSRFNLCKGEYGGPFSNELVEDVKTFIRISVMFIGVTFYMLWISLNGFSFYYVDHFPDSNDSLQTQHFQCSYVIKYYLSRHYTWWMMVFVLLYELILIPVLSYRMPNMFRRLSFTAVAIFFVVTTISALVTIRRYYYDFYNSDHLMIYQIGLSLAVGSIKGLFFITSLELICAQAPYSMRNYFISVAQTIGWCCPMLGPVVFVIWRYICSGRNCIFPYTLLSYIWCVIGMVGTLVLIKKYRKRSRGQEGEQNQRRWVEETYGKYVSENTSDFCRQSIKRDY